MNAITIQNLQKSYVPGVPVLKDFDFEIAEGEVHALVGSNGAGKSTLAKILTGLTPANSGNIDRHGRDESAIVLVLQELNIIPTLTIAENIYINALPRRFGVINQASLNHKAKQALGRVGLKNLDPSLPAGSLGVGQQQLIEIASALEKESSVLILDEPTAALTGPEIELLFDDVRALQKQGVAILYISHRMDEIARICDRVTVMRDGRRIATHQVSEVKVTQLVAEMAGSEISSRTAAPSQQKEKITGISVSNLNAGEKVKNVSFDAYRGEILGIAGLIGAGRTETLRAIFGADPINGGEVRLGPEQIPFHPKSPSDSVAKKLALVPEDRKQDGLLLPLSITANTVLASNRRLLLDEAGDRNATVTTGERLALKYDSPDQAVGDLSGGNQQKIVISRWLLCDSDIYLFDEPTRGVDVAAKESIYTLLDELVEANKTIILVSSDLTELMSISHRILVMSNGRITGEFEPETWTREAITAAAFAGYENRKEAAA